VFIVDVQGDVEGPLPPLELVIYEDGRVLWPTWPDDGAFAILEARLSAEGLAAVRDELLGSGFFADDLEIPPARTPDPNAGSGFATYELGLRVGDRLVTARTTSIWPSADGERLIALGERWRDPVQSVPGSAWARDTPGPIVFEPTAWYLQVYPTQGSLLEVSTPDIAELRPLIGDPLTFGAALGPDPSSGRCGVIDASAVDALVAYLRSRQLGPASGHRIGANLAWADGHGSVELYLVAALPHLAERCP
jgi:prepilin-type processing-associated H-X9-DG protein